MGSALLSPLPVLISYRLNGADMIFVYEYASVILITFSGYVPEFRE